MLRELITELKNNSKCPKCGGKPEYECDGDDLVWVACSVCGLMGKKFKKSCHDCAYTGAHNSWEETVERFTKTPPIDTL